MLPLLVLPIVAGAGLLGRSVYKAMKARNNSSSIPAKSILQINLERLGLELDEKVGRKIAVIGQPGAGKSSLLKQMTGDKIEPPPIVGIQTDATSWCHEASYELIGTYEEKHYFVDVPGYGTTLHSEHTIAEYFPFNKFDIIFFIFKGKLRGADLIVFSKALELDVNMFVCRSCAESLDESDRKEVVKDYKKNLSLHSSTSVLFFSSRSGEGVEDIFHLACADE